jgi:hypothetical protein
MAKQKLKIGDIFYLEAYPGKFVFGRLLFDVDQQYHKMAGTRTSINDYFPYLLMSHDHCQLIEMYKGIFDTPELTAKEVLIPRVFTINIDGKRNVLPWGIVGNKAVDYTKVEFPEHLNNKTQRTFLDRGELSIRTDLGDQAKYNVDIKTTINVPRVIGDACLFLQDRRDLIDPDRIWPNYIKDGDLLYYPELREKIYEQIGEDPYMDYYTLAKKHGFDLARFYK